MLYRLGEHEPTADGEFYVAETATVLGKVRLCKNAMKFSIPVLFVACTDLSLTPQGLPLHIYSKSTATD